MPWLTVAPKNSIKTKKKLCSEYIKHKTIFIENAYKGYKRILNNTIKKAERDHYDFLFRDNKDNLEKTWTIIKENEVIKILNALNISSPGWDGVHSKVIKETFPLYIEQLVHILNLSILQGVFPSELKTARVIPIYKSDNNMIISNHRPVSVLTVFSQKIERIMYNKLFNFIKKHIILCK